MTAILEVKNLSLHFPVYQGLLFRKQSSTIKAVDGISFEIQKGKTLGLVGESGCGKSSAVRAILQLHRPSAGEVWFAGQNLCQLSNEQMRPLRKKIQMIFQDPVGSLNPRMKAGDIVREPLTVHRIGKRSERERRVAELFELVGLHPSQMGLYPQQFSGGQRQRIGIARALATEPELILCDEPVSALDVSIRAQIINLLQDLQEKLGLSYLFITHDLALVQHLCHEVAVMYAGKIVEMAPTEQIFSNPKHSYTKKLLDSILVLKK